MGTTGMLTRGVTAGSLLAAALLLGGAGSASADGTDSTDSASPSPSASEGAGPTEAGTNFLNAKAFQPGQQATADASTGDYLYWVFPADAGQRPTVTAKVSFPTSAAARSAASTWQVDVYDGLRRRQPCVYGAQTRAMASDATTVEVNCTLRPVRAWADTWSTDPLPGSYYIRLTVVDAQAVDLGLPVRAEVGVAIKDIGGSQAVGGHLAKPLTPGFKDASTVAGGSEASSDAPSDEASDDAGSDDPSADPSADPQTAAANGEPEDGWSSGWWSDRWLWTAGGGVVAALAAIAGYSLARPSRRSSGLPPRM
ncbi:hypothetical protein QR77_33865 [Streptomyces sp. 150FB]|uniref:hypothetical protein n=1 Tax=Streptomyces sp. 150FB TaxID=1576605 RepID=UPI000589251E|nr:hypothetical protein [Streptomyces sp. 150FB]KIF77493.1 hypothetical protein QR77_33865 [Streptomyces sp. 150FB]